MADFSPTTSSKDTSAVAGSSSFQRTVSLSDWWLVKAENDFQGKRLAVAGITSKTTDSSSKLGKGAMRVFVSAPVIKRYDVFSVETADGIYVIINGFINEKRTLENGFSPEVFNCFLFGFPSNWERYAVDCFREESANRVDSSNAVPDNIPANEPEIFSDGVEKSIPTTSLASPEDASGEPEKPFAEDEFNVSMEMGRDSVVDGSAGNGCSTPLHNIKVCQQKSKRASGRPPKHTEKVKISTSGAFLDSENPDGVGLKSPVTPVQSQLLGQVNASSEQPVKKSASRISRALSPNTEGSFLDLENPDGVGLKSPVTPVQSQLLGQVNASSEQPIKKSASRISRALSPNTEGSILDLANSDGEGLNGLVTPVQSQPLGQVNASSEQPVKKSASRISRGLPPNTECCHKKKRVTAKTKAISPKRKITKSASATKYPRQRDESPLIKGGNQKISLDSPKSLSFRKSRSGRLLLPPLEFWRNQIPVYNADRELSEIQDGASLVSPFKGSSPSLNRKSKNQKPAARRASVS